MSLRQLTGTILFRLSQWLSDHRGEILWAGAFGVLFAGVAWFLAPPKPEPYKVYILADHHTDRSTMNMFLAKSQASHETPFRRVNEVPVEIEVDQLPDDFETTIRKKAEEISGRSDALLVIGHLPSQLAEAALPVFFQAQPKVPFIATVSSDDNLLSRCPSASNCFDEDQFAPLLQLTPTNEAQGQSAVTYAILQGKRRFLIVYDNDDNNASYTSNLVGSCRMAIDKFNQSLKGAGAAGKPALTVGVYKMDQPPNADALREWKSDCILYAGGMGEGLSLLTALSSAKFPTMVIFSDSSVQDGFSLDELRKFPGILFTNQVDATDFNDHNSVYAVDALAIAEQLIDDVQERGQDVRLRLKTLFHIAAAQDVRLDLDRVMKQNSISRSWYQGSAPGTVYAFNKYRRFGGMFHVWQLRNISELSAEMEDVDHWHIPKTSGEADRRKVTSVMLSLKR